MGLFNNFQTQTSFNLTNIPANKHLFKKNTVLNSYNELVKTSVVSSTNECSYKQCASGGAYLVSVFNIILSVFSLTFQHSVVLPVDIVLSSVIVTGED